MLCTIESNTKETVISKFKLNNLIAEDPTTSGAFVVLKPEEFDRANNELNDAIFENLNIRNTLWVRVGGVARFNTTLSELVNVVMAREGKSFDEVYRPKTLLQVAREQISTLNADLVHAIGNNLPMEQLIEQRNKIVLDVAKYKRDNGLPIFDSAREQVVLEDVAALAQEMGLDQEKVKVTFQLIMDASKQLQEDFLGLKSGNRAQATQKFFEEVVSGEESHKPMKSWSPLLIFSGLQDRFASIYAKFVGNFDSHIATSIPTFRETQIKVGTAISKMLVDLNVKVMNPVLVSLKDQYMKKFGLTKAPVYKKFDRVVFDKLAALHNNANDDRRNPEMMKSYRALMDETKAQYEMLVAAGYEIRPYLGDGEPYGVESDAVRNDIQNNKRLFYLMSRAATGSGDENMSSEDYILFEDTGITIDGQQVVFNDLFRAVHDIFGHGMMNNSFSTQGEFNAYNTHRVMYSEAAQKALFMETVVYNAFYNKNKSYGPRKIYNIPNSLIEETNSVSTIMDIGGSEGSFVKAITELSGGGVESTNLDPNPGMVKAFNSTPVKGSKMVVEAFYEGFDEFAKHEPVVKSDIVHESMTFQFIDSARAAYLKEVKDKYLKEGGLFLSEEKVIPIDPEEWKANEDNKDKNYKAKYYKQEQVTRKQEQVLTGMLKNQTYAANYKTLLQDTFEYVEEYWDAGNFRGYVASDSKAAVDSFLQNLGGKITSKFSSSAKPPANTPLTDATEAPSSKIEAYSKETKSRVKPGKSVGSMLVSTKKGEKYRGPLSLEAVKEHSPITYVNRAEALAETHLVPGTNDLASITSEDKIKSKIPLAEITYRKALDTAVANLLFIHDKMPAAQRSVAKLWYDGANRIAQELSKKYGISLEQASAVIATQSPQTPWYDNVHHAHFIIDFFKNQQDKVLTQAHLDYFKKTAEAYPDQQQFIPLLSNDIGLKFSELGMLHKAIMMRAVFDNEYDRRAPLRLPSGEIVGQLTSISSFNSYPFLVKAIEILTDPSTIDANLGNAPKVRNFYNNIVDPNLEGEVTIDTHAIAAAYLMPYGSSSNAVKFDIGSASFFAQAYREAAEKRGILAREMQSITWEGARAMFPQNAKSASFEKKIGDIWQQFKDGKTTLEETLNEIYANSFEIKTDWADQLSNSILTGPQNSDILSELRRSSGVSTSSGPRDSGGTESGVPGLGTGAQREPQSSSAEELGIVLNDIPLNSNPTLSEIKNTPFSEETGATLNLDGSIYSGGNLVIPMLSINTTQSELSGNSLKSFVENNWEAISTIVNGPNNTGREAGVTINDLKIGFFKFSDSDVVSIDLNLLVSPDYEKVAVDFAKQAGQFSIWNLGTMSGVETSATGENPVSFNPSELHQIAKSLLKGEQVIVKDLVGATENAETRMMAVWSKQHPWAADSKNKELGEKMLEEATAAGNHFAKVLQSAVDKYSFLTIYSDSNYEMEQVSYRYLPKPNANTDTTEIYSEWDTEKKKPIIKVYDSTLVNEAGDIINPDFKSLNDKSLPIRSSEFDENHLYRGISKAELVNALQNGYIKSDARSNLSGQENTTSFAQNSGQATNYASGFNGWNDAVTFNEPKYVIKVAKDGVNFTPTSKNDPRGEVDVSGSIPISNILEIHEIRLASATEGDISIIKERFGKISEGSRSGMQQEVLVRKTTISELSTSQSSKDYKVTSPGLPELTIPDNFESPC